MDPVRITAKNPPIDIKVPRGDGPAYITGGLGGWTTIPLVDNVEGVDWEGQAPVTVDLPLFLNAYGVAERGDGLTPPRAVDDHNDDVEREWNTIKKLGRDPNGDERKPPVFTVEGVGLDFPEKAWVLGGDGITVIPDEIIRRNGSGELLRIEFVLHLLEFRSPEVIKARRRKNKDKGQNPNGGITAPGNTYVTKKGDTLVKIAAAIYGDWQSWKDIAAKNNMSDPNRKLPAGKKLRLP